jgi:hypothetical protein
MNYEGSARPAAQDFIPPPFARASAGRIGSLKSDEKSEKVDVAIWVRPFHLMKSSGGHPMPTSYTTAQIVEVLERVSNWGRWGADDQRGALNYITKEKRAAAAKLVNSGETVSLSLPLPTRPARDNPTPVTHLMIRSGQTGHPLGSFGCADYFAIEPHGLATTHLDALCHHFWRGKLYNGFDATNEIDFQGAHKCAIDVARDGIIGRGVLIDIPRLRGVEWL